MAAEGRAIARELAEFEGGRRDPATFDHREHVRLAYEMLARHPFDRALARYARGLRRTAARAGAPERYHMTITVAFLAVIAERRALAGPGGEGEERGAGFEAGARATADLLDPGCLRRWYDPARLASAEARRTFILPAPAGA